MDSTIIQLSGKNTKGDDILSVITKRTYIFDQNKLILSNDQIPINSLLKYYEKTNIIKSDIDTYFYKPKTDVVIKGKARNTLPVQNFNVSIEIERFSHHLSIFGNRNVYKDNNGNFKFTESNLIQEIDLNYKNSYGGKDLIAEKPLRDKIKQIEELKYSHEFVDILEASPFRYQRNPEGKGYIIDTCNENIESLELPNIENPHQLLNPQNFICNNVDEWYKMPTPVNTDWVHPAWFPRIAYFGMYPLPHGLDSNIFEIAKGWSNSEILNSTDDLSKAITSFRATNGASLGLQVKHLQGGESIRLTNIHPKHSDFTFQLPKERPQIKVDGRNGKLLKTNPVIHSVIIEPDEHRVSIVWCGSAKAIRPYFEEELKTMPFEVKW